MMTAHEATVLDVFKTDSRAVAAGSSMTILQYGGIIRRVDGLHSDQRDRFHFMLESTERALSL